MLTMNRQRLASLLLIAAPLLACSKEAEVPPPPVSALPEAFLLPAKPAAAKGVLEVRASASPGDQVVVAGRAKDFVDGRAVFTITDPSLKPCDEEGPMGDCKTPWDYCCTEASEVAKATATIELHDASGLARSSVRGFHGLDHLKRVIVPGVLAKDESGNVSVIAKAIYLEP
jgi:hypothetical protein